MPRLELSLLAKRNAGFHFWKVLVPLAMIVAMAWAVFWIDPEQLAPQMGVSTASVLTLIAFQFSLGYLLPRVSYLTRADRFVLGASTLVFLALAEAILSSRLAAAGRIELALRMDRHSRWIYPVLFLAMALRTLRF